MVAWLLAEITAHNKQETKHRLAAVGHTSENNQSKRNLANKLNSKTAQVQSLPWRAATITTGNKIHRFQSIEFAGLCL